MGSLEIRPVHSTGDLRAFIRAAVPPLPRRAQLGRAAPASSGGSSSTGARTPSSRTGGRSTSWRCATGARSGASRRRSTTTSSASRRTAGAGSASSSAEQDPEAAAALLDRADQWLRGQNCDRMVGPADFTTNDECGVLIEGHERTPLILSPWTHRYYPALLDGAGMEKAMDLLMWRAGDRRARQGQPDRLEARRPGRAAPRHRRAAVPQARPGGRGRRGSSRSTTPPGRRTGASSRSRTPRCATTPPAQAVPRRELGLRGREGRRDGGRGAHAARLQPGAAPHARPDPAARLGQVPLLAAQDRPRARVRARGQAGVAAHGRGREVLRAPLRRRRAHAADPRGDGLDPRDQQEHEPGDGGDGRRDRAPLPALRAPAPTR